MINDIGIEVVSSAKLLGLTNSNDLKWNANIENACKKVSSWLGVIQKVVVLRRQCKLQAKSEKVVNCQKCEC